MRFWMLLALMLAVGVPSAKAQRDGGGDRFGRVNDEGWDMGPPVTAELVARVVAAESPKAEGPFEPTWESLQANYKLPEWFRVAKFGLYMHWGLHSIPAHHNEWYVKHMYGNRGIQAWHVEHFGPVDTFGYKDFIPRFTVEKFDPEAWAELFQQAGAKYILPTAEHHDGFSLWASAINKYNAADMGPKRDLIGELAAAVRKRGLKFGVANHSIEHFTFIETIEGVTTDLDDPQWADFYSVADRSDAALEEHLKRWIRKNIELIDKYEPDLLWFDNGVNHRLYDPLKLTVAAYYYNRARQWGKEVSIVSKKNCFLAGSIMDYERQNRAPREITDFVWQPDDPIGPTFGYTTDMPVGRVDSFIRRIVEDVSRNGNYGLNISPTGEGSIPENQQAVLRGIGKWLAVNGEAIYGTRPWTRDAEGDFRFTTRGDTLYAIALRWPRRTASITALGKRNKDLRRVSQVRLLGHVGELEFVQDAEALRVTMPDEPVGEHAFALRISQDAPLSRKFDFGSGEPRDGYVRVSPDTSYTDVRGYGFEEGGDQKSFSVKLPEGNYRVKVVTGDRERPTDTTVKAELRRLMIEAATTRAGEFRTSEFVVNVRTPKIAGGGRVRLKDRENTSESRAWDDRLTLEFGGEHPGVASLEIERVDDVPVLYIIGDSTVCDQPGEPYAGWGQMLTRFFRPTIVLANHAESGESYRSALSARRFDKIFRLMRPGDFLLMQFGHNDMKAVDEKSYAESIRRVVATCREKQGVPIIVAPMERLGFDDHGTVKDSLKGFPQAARDTARELDVPLVDLNAMSREFYEALGPEKALLAFAKPYGEKPDFTHHNNYGGYELAKCVVEGIRREVPKLATHLVEGLPEFDPGRPDAVETFGMRAGAQSGGEKPDGS